MSTAPASPRPLPATLRLYEIPGAYEAVLALIDDAEGELGPELEAELDRLDDALASKAGAICGVVKSLEATARAAKAEADRLTSLAAHRERAAARLRSYLKAAMDALNVRSLESGTFRVRIQVNSAPTVTCGVPLEDLPVEYIRVKAELDGRAVAAAWRDGRPLPEGVRVERGEHLRIG